MADLKTYRVAQEFGDIEVVLNVDHNKLTPAMATEINGFWINSDYRLECAEGNAVLAVIRLAAANLMDSLLRGETITAAQRDLDTSEGWPADHGITLMTFDGLPEIGSTDLVVEEIEA